MSAIIHFGADGWRARRDGDFTEDNVRRIADAVASIWSRGSKGAIVYVGYDAREGAGRFARIAAETLAGHGLVAKLSDSFIPTPALSWTVANDPRACGGLMITGSHHPMDYLGIKIRVADGGGGSIDFIEEVEDAIDPDPLDVTGPVSTCDIMGHYLDGLIALVDAEAIRKAGLRVVCDPMYGSARGYLAETLRRLGVTVEEIHGQDDADLDDMRPEAIEPWVDDCEQAAMVPGVSAGLLTDGDADRAGAVDEKGNYVSPQKIIALLIGDLVEGKGQTGRVVLSLSTSTLPRRVARALGCRVTIKPIGFEHIYMEMLKGDVLLGGEESGGIGFPGHVPARDGLLVCLLLVELMAKTGMTLSQLVESLEERFGEMSYARRDLRLESDVIESLRNMIPGINPRTVAGMEPIRVSHMDGLRLDFADESWLLVRPGATEQVVRVYAEAPTVEKRDELLDAGAELARGKW